MDPAVQASGGVGRGMEAGGERWRGHLSAWLSLAVALILLCGSPLPAWAHSDLSSTLSLQQSGHHVPHMLHTGLPGMHRTFPATPWAPLVVVLCLLTAVAIASHLWRWRRTAALGLTLVLGTFTFETAIHSVHHLLEPERAGTCLMFSASQHMTGATPEACDIHAPAWFTPTPSPDLSDVPSLSAGCRIDLPRGPPSLLA
jgi:hypothetical protein